MLTTDQMNALRWVLISALEQSIVRSSHRTKNLKTDASRAAFRVEVAEIKTLAKLLPSPDALIDRLLLQAEEAAQC